AGFKPNFTAGHSFGELTALWAAGVYDDNTFLALAKKRDHFITDSILVQLLIPMTKDSLSNINLDWGCGQSSIQPFEYLMHVLVGNKRKTFLTNIIPLSHENVKLLINERKPYFPQTNQYKMGWTWEEYETKFLKN
ncbi:MAG: hypothetical protein ACPGVD_03145, partial [Flavobacteriales bacterium]